MLKTTKKVISLILAIAAMGTSAMLTGCSDDGKVKVTIGDWPADTDSIASVYQEYKNKMSELYPDIELIPDSSTGNATNYVTRAISGQLPNLYVLSYTEAESILDEWNYVENWGDGFCDSIKTIIGYKGAAYTLATMCDAQNGTVDMLMHTLMPILVLAMSGGRISMNSIS